MKKESSLPLFATEINSSYHKIIGNEETPNYIVTPMSAFANRVIICGILVEKTNLGDDENPFWYLKIKDINDDFFHVNIGKYHQELIFDLEKIEIMEFVSVVGKLSLNSNEGKQFVSIYAEKIIVINKILKNKWLFMTLNFLWNRMEDIKKFVAKSSENEEYLKKSGRVDQVKKTLEYYGVPEDSKKYFFLIQESLKELLPDSNIFFEILYEE